MRKKKKKVLTVRTVKSSTENEVEEIRNDINKLDLKVREQEEILRKKFDIQKEKNSTLL